MNKPITLRIKKNDTVIVRIGREKGKTGKVLRVYPRTQMVEVEGINIVTKHVKPNATTSRGSIEKIIKPVPLSKVAIVHPSKQTRGSRIAYETKGKDNKKVRVYRQADNKEIK
ncbi:MAG TPA: 50S ribosomal protein L24 [Candidatus Saccharimonadales bacterium]|nr:50S ribosomal protein L24 [Candidatus Saccharimonadales bacterium]